MFCILPKLFLMKHFSILSLSFFLVLRSEIVSGKHLLGVYLYSVSQIPYP